MILAIALAVVAITKEIVCLLVCGTPNISYTCTIVCQLLLAI